MQRARRPAQLGPQPAPLPRVEAIRVERDEQDPAVGEAVVQAPVRQREEAQVVLEVVVVVVADAGPERLRGDQVAQRAEHEPPVFVLGAVDLRVVAGGDRKVDRRVGRQAAQVRARGGRPDAEVPDHAEREPIRPGHGRAEGGQLPELAVGLPLVAVVALRAEGRAPAPRGGGSARRRARRRRAGRPPGRSGARSWPGRRSARRPRPRSVSAAGGRARSRTPGTAGS